MIKSELVTRIAAANPHLLKRDVEAIITTILDTMAAALARGSRRAARLLRALDQAAARLRGLQPTHGRGYCRTSESRDPLRNGAGRGPSPEPGPATATAATNRTEGEELSQSAGDTGECVAA